MTQKSQLKEKLEQLEIDTVSNSFGGTAIDGKAPTFAFKPIMEWIGSVFNDGEEDLARSLSILKEKFDHRGFKYTLECLGRFAFCIELTNLNITSTKMKTRWVPGRITKTRPGTYSNYEGDFKPGEDERSASFDECYSIFCKAAALLAGSAQHQNLMMLFSDQKKRGTPYEAVFTYINPKNNPVHATENIRLVNTQDAEWLAHSRPIIQPVLKTGANDEKTKLIEKIATKCYKTDRSQTGEVQTNRAKRWECLADDFQHATIEECWSVERKLLSDVAHFQGFPVESRQELISSRLFNDQGTTLCPITFKPMVFQDLLGGGGHGESKFQVGHMMPLKAGGRHIGENIEWISSDGNRIQGSLNIHDTRQMLKDIFTGMTEHGLL